MKKCMILSPTAVGVSRCSSRCWQRKGSGWVACVPLWSTDDVLLRSTSQRTVSSISRQLGNEPFLSFTLNLQIPRLWEWRPTLSASADSVGTLCRMSKLENPCRSLLQNKARSTAVKCSHFVEKSAEYEVIGKSRYGSDIHSFSIIKALKYCAKCWTRCLVQKHKWIDVRHVPPTQATVLLEGLCAEVIGSRCWHCTGRSIFFLDITGVL